MKKVYLILTIFLLISAFFNLKVAFAATDISLDINPNPVAIGENFSIYIKAQSADTNFYYSELELSYDKNLIEFLNASTSAGSLAGGCASGTIAYSDRSENGTIFAQIFRSGCNPLAITNETSLIILNFRASSTGTYNFAFSNTVFQSSNGVTANNLTWSGGQININNETNPPVRSNGSPIGSLAMNTTSATISLNTDEIADCRYDTDSDIEYDFMGNIFSNTDSTFHSTLISGLANGQSYNYYIKCADASNNKNIDDFMISFNVVDTAMVILSPAISNAVLGNNFDITLSVSSVTNFGYLITNLSYDNTKLELVSFDFTSDILNNCQWSYYDSSIPGSISMVEVDCFNAPKTGDIALATLHFNTVSISANSLVEIINTEDLPIILQDSDYYDIPFTSQNALVNINSAFDAIAPASINNLTATSSTANSITLLWTATGDDNNSGTATSYDIRYSTSNIITAADWNSAMQVVGEPVPQTAGTSETFTVTSLTFNTNYYFAIKASDEIPNTSGLSNISGYTLYRTADINMDTYVNSVDASILMFNWNSTAKPKADINQNGIVNSQDAAIMMSQWSI